MNAAPLVCTLLSNFPPFTLRPSLHLPTFSRTFQSAKERGAVNLLLWQESAHQPNSAILCTRKELEIDPSLENGILPPLKWVLEWEKLWLCWNILFSFYKVQVHSTWLSPAQKIIYPKKKTVQKNTRTQRVHCSTIYNSQDMEAT